MAPSRGWDRIGFAQLLRMHRAKIDASQLDLARELEVSQATISRWSRGIGQRPPTRDQARQLEELLDLEPGEIALLTGNLPMGDPKVERRPDGALVLLFPGRAKGAYDSLGAFLVLDAA